MSKIKSISVFCGSSMGNDPDFATQAYLLGQKLAENQISLIYGGAKVGLMGAVANGALGNNGNVIGVIPTFLKAKEVAHEHLTTLIEVESMHTRKTVMDQKSDGVVVLPGGFGTLDEMFEMLTWGQLGHHKKPILIFNVNGYFDHLLAFIEHTIENGLVKPIYREMLLVTSDLDEILGLMNAYQAPDTSKWIMKS